MIIRLVLKLLLINSNYQRSSSSEACTLSDILHQANLLLTKFGEKVKNANSVLSIFIYCPPAYICIFNFKTLTSFHCFGKETPTIHATQVFTTLYSTVGIYVPVNALKTGTLKKVMYKLKTVCIPIKKKKKR